MVLPSENKFTRQSLFLGVYLYKQIKFKQYKDRRFELFKLSNFNFNDPKKINYVITDYY